MALRQGDHQEGMTRKTRDAGRTGRAWLKTVLFLNCAQDIPQLNVQNYFNSGRGHLDNQGSKQAGHFHFFSTWPAYICLAVFHSILFLHLGEAIFEKLLVWDV